MQDTIVNALLDSGAGCSILDVATLQKLGLEDKLVKSDYHRLVNASGENMDIIGVVNVNVQIDRGVKPVKHEFKVLNTNWYRTVLIGRDFLKLFGTVKFDFANNKIQLGKTWIKGVNLDREEKVRLKEASAIPARSEQVVTVRCKTVLMVPPRNLRKTKLQLDLI